MTPMQGQVPPARAGASRLAAAGMGQGGNPGTDGGKLSFKDVNYRPAENPQQSCVACEYADGQGGCAKVAGQIQPQDTCDLWEPKETQAAEAAESAQEPMVPGGGMR